MKRGYLKIICILLLVLVFCSTSVYALTYTCGNTPLNDGKVYDCNNSPLNAGGTPGHYSGGTVCSPYSGSICNICSGNYATCPHSSGTTYGGTVCSPSNGICNICHTSYATCPHYSGTTYGGTVCSPYSASICNICNGNYASCPHISGQTYGGTWIPATPNTYHIHNSSCAYHYTTHSHTSSCSYTEIDDFVSGTWSDPSHLTIQRFTSTNVFNSGIWEQAFQWNGIDPNLYIRSTTYNSDDTDSGCNIRVVGKNIDGACGLTGNYIKVWDVYPISYHYELSWSGSWVYSEIQLMTNPGRLIARDLNYQTKIYVHELGHSVALSHPESTATQAIMRSDIATDSVAIYTVQQNDKDNLLAKW